MISKVQDVYYNVQDMKRAVSFYSEILGMTVLDTNEWWSSLKLGEMRIGLHGTGGTPVPHVFRDSHGAHAGATLTLHSTDIVADGKRLRDAGAKILGELNEPWGKLVVFEDTEGNVLKLMQPA
jgi:predicted enzyme related to lactoylglutathione lyase